MEVKVCEDVCGVALITFVGGIGGFIDANDSFDEVDDDVTAWVDAVIVGGEVIIGDVTVDVIVGIVCTWFNVFSEKSVVDPAKSVKYKFVIHVYNYIPY